MTHDHLRHLAPEPKAYRRGTHRVRDPDATWAMIEPLFTHFGITRVADVTRLDHIGIPVASAIRPNARSLSVAQGKGSTWADARVSAAMESIECWHAEHVELAAERRSYLAMRGEAAVLAPAQLPIDHRTMYHDHLVLPWVRGWDLVDERETWVPRELVGLDLVDAAAPDPVCFQRGSNGLASGNTVLEASLHALYELIERDASSLWLCRQIRGGIEHTKVDPETIDHEPARALLDRFEAAGFEVAIFDQTSDVGIPTFGCSIYEREPMSWANSLGLMGGNGCHLDRGVALLRALHEAAQSRLTYISGARDDLPYRDYRDAWALTRGPDSPEPALLSLPASRDYRAAPDIATEDLRDDLARVLGSLAGVGLTHAVIVDLTQPELGVAVVRAIVPELEHLGEAGEELRIGRRARAALGR